MVIFNQRTVGYFALLLAMRFLPPNGSRASKPRFDLPSAVMNALTFGLLICVEWFRSGAIADID